MEARREERKEQRGADADRVFSLRVESGRSMLKGFGSVGVFAFDLTCTDLETKKAVYRGNRPLPTLIAQVPVILQTADSRQWNVIVRPHAPEGRVLIQLDDLDREKLSRVHELAFLTFETSPQSFQAWLAVEAESSESLIRRCRQGAGADVHASGATRLAGSHNFKRKYEPEFPIVALLDVVPGRTVTMADLESRKVLAPEGTDHRPPYAPAERKRGREFSKMVPPSYERCLADAPAARNHDGKDRSYADFEYALIAIDRGFSPAQTAELLIQVSEKAAGEGKRYAEFTANRAADIVQKRRGG